MCCSFCFGDSIIFRNCLTVFVIEELDFDGQHVNVDILNPILLEGNPLKGYHASHQYICELTYIMDFTTIILYC